MFVEKEQTHNNKIIFAILKHITYEASYKALAVKARDAFIGT